MTMTTLADELRLHRTTDPETGSWIWFSRRGQYTAYPLSVAEFIAQDWVQAASTIRLLGSIENAPLILSLYASRRLTGRPVSIQLGNPNHCIWPAERPSVPMVFQRMAALDSLRPSVGGWHEMTKPDYPSYSLSQSVYAARGRVTSLASSLLRHHPAWPAVSFSATANSTRAALLLALMIDPRWYVDPQHPDRAASLKASFGLRESQGQGALQAVLDDKLDSLQGTAQTKAARAQIVLDSWAGSQRNLAREDVTYNPRKFLWKISHASSADTHSARGLLRASHVFLRLVSEFWKSEICAIPRSGLFVAEHFFRDADVTREWHLHCSDCIASSGFQDPLDNTAEEE